MALKTPVYEKCPECGWLAAEKLGDWISIDHQCPKAPPGPPNPPRRVHASKVQFIRGEFTVDELREQLDDLRAEYFAVREERMHLRAAMRDVETALRRAGFAKQGGVNDAE